jgi:hypothetical protein
MEYRLVVLSSAGEPASFEHWNCASDVEAAERASHHGSAYGLELWQGGRKVSAFSGAMTSTMAEEASPTAAG